jgi:stage II sporulation SpoE-like protein
VAHSRVGTRTRSWAFLALLVMGAFAIGPVWGAAIDGAGVFGFRTQIFLWLALGAGSASLVAHGLAIGRRLQSEGDEDDDIERVRRELSGARSAQERFLPRSLPQVPGIDLWAANISANEVSGDCYDVFDGGEGRPIVLAIADVCGKGLPAALLNSAVHGVLRSNFMGDDYDLERTTQNLNRLVHRDAHPGSFVTMVLAEIDKSGRHLRYIRAGHEIPLVVSRDGAVRRLDEGNFFLGLYPEVEYKATSEELAPGEVLCLYTDGVTDATHERGEPFGEARLIEVLSSVRDEHPAAIGSAVLAAVAAHCEPRRPSDDVTLVVMKIVSAPQSVSALDGDRGAGDVIGARIDERQHDPGDVFRLGDLAQRDLPLELGEEVPLEPLCGHLGERPPWSDGVDGDSEWPELDGEGASYTIETGLRRGVVRVERLTHQRSGR